MPDRKLLPGKFVWFELVSRDAKRAQAFYGEVLGWKTMPFRMGNTTYEMICAGETADTMIGGYAAPKSDRQTSHWSSYVSVEDVDATAKAAAANGGRGGEAPYQLPHVRPAAPDPHPPGGEVVPFPSNTGGSAGAAAVA